MNHLKHLALIFIFGFTFNANAQTIESVCNKDQLDLLLQNSLQKGSIITLCDSYQWDSIQIKIKGIGTADMPIILKSESIGGVHLTGNSTIAMGGEYIYIDGFSFTNGEPSNSFVIDFQFNTSTPCSNCLLQNVTIDAYDSGGLQDTSKVTNWVRLYGTNNEVAHCSFLNRKSKGTCIAVFRDSFIEDFHKIHHNYFAHRIPTETENQNGQEAIRIGDSKTWKTVNASCEIFNNYFYNWIGEVEIISNKSSNNKYYNNTFDSCMGALTLRHGNNCEVYSNFFLAKNVFKSGGIRIIGEGHKVFNNYIDNTYNGSSNAVGAINISNGEPNPPDSGYQAVEDVMIAFNTIVYGDKGIRVGSMVQNHLSVPPKNCIIANNLMQDAIDAIEWIIHDTVDVDTDNTYWNNTRNGGSWDLYEGFGSGNDVTSSLLLEEVYVDGFRRIRGGTIALNESIGNFPFVIRDIQGALRPSVDILKDAGVEEYGTFGINRPYMPSDINSLVGAGSGFSDTCNSDPVTLPFLYTPNQNFNTLKYISAKGIVRSEYDLNFIAKESVLLNPDFEVFKGAIFSVNIDDCSLRN